MDSYFRTKPADKKQAIIESLLREMPDKIPIIIERQNGIKNLPTLEKKKFLVNPQMTFGALRNVVIDRLDSKQSIILTINNIIPLQTITIGELYKKYADIDKFLYCAYRNENVFG